MLELSEGPIFDFDRYIPRGKEWNKRAMEMPQGAVPFQKSAVILSGPTGLQKVLSLNVRNDVNGLRISEITHLYVTGNNTDTVFIRRNGVAADPALDGSFFLITSNNNPLVMPVFLFYEAGDLLEVGYNAPAGTPTLFMFLKGWYF